MGGPAMNVVIRADASNDLGSGHVMRCAALAERLQQRGADITFICRELPGDYCDWLEKRRFRVIRLRARADRADSSGVPLEMEIEQSRSALMDIGPVDWLIVDHYELDSRWERALRPSVHRIMAIDDLADRDHDVDLFLNQNLQPESDRHAARTLTSCVRLLGPQFALLRPEFRIARNCLRERDGRVRSALIFVGGSDPHNYTARFLDAWASAPTAGIALDVIVGLASRHRQDIERRCAAMANARLHVQTPDMADLMSRADLMMGGAGSTTWERCCMGLPCVLVSIADNQREIGRLIAQRRAAIYLGDIGAVTQEELTRAITRLVQHPALVRGMARKAFGLVDGFGTDRVVAALYGNLRISIVSDRDSWINEYLPGFVSVLESDGHEVCLLHDPSLLPEGDCAFFLGCGRIVGGDVLARNVHNLVVHESDLPKGRGWSPLTWQVLEGRRTIPVTLFEATQNVDSGVIYLKDMIELAGHELVEEIRAKQAASTIALCRRFIAAYPAIVSDGTQQTGKPGHYPRRRPEDSRLDPDRTLREQLNLLRVVDNDQYPAFFEIDGIRYRLRVDKVKS